jgi:oligopeptidase B
VCSSTGLCSFAPAATAQAKAYPNMLVRTSFNDSQVGYWEPAKYTAKMRATRTDHNTIILKTNMNPAGHGGVSGRYDCLHENAFDYACFLTKWASTTDRILHVRSSAHFVLLFFPIKSQS